MKPRFIIGLCLVMALLTCGTASAWLDDYQYRQEIMLTGGASGAHTNFQVMLNVTYNSHMQPDFDDLRFTDTSDVLIDAWMESNSSGYALIWVEFPSTPANGVDQIYRMYYGNGDASSNWNGTETFNFFDDFNRPDSPTVGNGWAETGSASIISNNLSAGSATVSTVERSFAFSSGSYAADIRMNSPSHSKFCYNLIDDGTQTSWLSASRDTAQSTQIYTTSPTNVLLDPYSVGKWYILTNARVDSANYDYFIDYGKTGTSFYNQDPTSASSNPDKWRIGIANSIVCDVDWAKIRKYSATPPSSSFGSEDDRPLPPYPSITYTNNVTAAQSHVPIDYGTPVMFTSTSNTDVTWSWTLDGVDQSNPHDNYTHTFTGGFGYYAVTVNATNAAGSAHHTWGIWENIETTAETIPTFTDTSYQMLLDSIDYPPDMEDFGKALAHPFVQMVGVIFYLFIFGIPLTMMYIRQDNMTLPTTLLLLFGSIIIFMLPPQWQIIAGALMTLGFVGILFKLYKERER